MITLLGFIMTMSPFVFLFSLFDADTDIWDAIKLTAVVDLGIAFVGVGCLVMIDGGLFPL